LIELNHFSRDTFLGGKIIVLLAGGSKRTQKADIKRARALVALLDDEGNENGETN
jgi:putative component of toxin-antitoxin plasmid stabilization module